MSDYKKIYCTNWLSKTIYIKKFNENDVFNPFDTLENIQSKKQEIYELYVKFLVNLRKLSQEFKENRDKIVFDISKDNTIQSKIKWNMKIH